MVSQQYSPLWQHDANYCYSRAPWQGNIFADEYHPFDEVPLRSIKVDYRSKRLRRRQDDFVDDFFTEKWHRMDRTASTVEHNPRLQTVHRSARKQYQSRIDSPRIEPATSLLSIPLPSSRVKFAYLGVVSGEYGDNVWGRVRQHLLYYDEDLCNLPHDTLSRLVRVLNVAPPPFSQITGSGEIYRFAQNYLLSKSNVQLMHEALDTESNRKAFRWIFYCSVEKWVSVQEILEVRNFQHECT